MQDANQDTRTCCSGAPANPTAVLQIASRDADLVVHIGACGGIPTTVATLLNDPQVCYIHYTLGLVLGKGLCLMASSGSSSLRAPYDHHSATIWLDLSFF